MAEPFSRRTSSKRRITNIANRFDQIKGEVNVHKTAQGLREDMREALSKFGEIDEQLWSLLEAAEVSADRTTTSHTVSEDITDSDQYITKAEDTLLEISRYLENHPAEVNPAVSVATSVPSSARGHKISFRAMIHDDCRLWFAQLEDFFCVTRNVVANQQVCRPDDPSDRGGSIRCSRLDDDGRRPSVQRFRCGDVPVR